MAGQPHAQAAQVAAIRRSMILIAAAGAAVAAAAYQFAYVPQQQIRDEATTALAQVEQLILDERADLAAVRSDGPNSTRVRFEQAKRLNAAVPVVVDDVEFALWLTSTVPAGVTAPDVPPLPEPQADSAVPGMQRYVLKVQATGPTPALTSWVRLLQNTRGRLVTVADASFAGLDATTSSLQMTLHIWEMAEPPLITDVG